MDPRRRAGKAKAPLAPGARRLGAATSDNESLPSAPSLGCPSASPERGESPKRKVLVSGEAPRAAILRPQRGEERARKRLAPALVLRGRAEVEGRKKDPSPSPQPEPARKSGKVKGDKAKTKKAEKVEKPRPAEEEAPRKKKKTEQKVKKSRGSPEKSPEKEVEDRSQGNVEEKKKKKKEKKRKEKDPKEPEKKDDEPEEPSDTEVVRPASPAKNGKSKRREKAKPAEKVRNKEKKEPSKRCDAEKVEEKKEKSRRKERKSKQPEPERSKSEDPPAHHTADEPPLRRGHGSSKPPRERPKERRPRSGRPMTEVPEVPPDVRDRRRRKERPRSASSRSRHRRRRVLPSEAWQVWPAGSYHPWSSQLAGAPFTMWPMSSMSPADMSQAWMSNMQQGAHLAAAQAAVQPDSDSEKSETEDESAEEDLEGREFEAPQEAEEPEEQEEQEEQEDQDEEEEEPEKPAILKTMAVPQIAVPDDEDDGSATTRTSEGEESETESQDEDAEIGEAPVARRPMIALSEDIPMIKAKWFPPGPERPRDPLHRSMQRWSGPKVGWMQLYQLEIDAAVQMKPIAQQIREGDGKGVVDPDASEIEAISEANPMEAPLAPLEATEAEAPLLIPRWGSTRGWAKPTEVLVEDSLRWEKRKLSSVVLRSRRTGRSANGGGAGANPQDPPEAPKGSQSEGSTFLIFLGAVARSVRMVQWRPPPVLVLPEDLMVDPTKYRGLEGNLRMKRREGTRPAAKKKAALKSSPGVPPAKAAADPQAEYKAKLRGLIQQIQDGAAEREAVSSFWSTLSPANQALFRSEFPQFMHLVVPDGAVQTKAVGVPAMAPPLGAHMLPPGMQLAPGLMHLPLPPPPKTAPPGGVPVPMAALGMPVMAVPQPPPMGWPKVAAPVATPKLAPEIVKQQEAAWADRLTFHDGILRADMSSLQLGDAGLARWCQWAPSLLKTLSSAQGAPLSNADLNFSGNAIEDAGLRPLLQLLRSCDVHVNRLNLDANRLTDASLVAISDFISASRGAVSDVHLKNNRVQGSRGVMHLTKAMKNNDKYPMFLPDKNRYTPLMLHLAGNMIERPMQVTQLVKEALDSKFPSLSEDRQYWESKSQCPPLQLPCFDKQETSPFQ